MMIVQECNGMYFQPPLVSAFNAMENSKYVDNAHLLSILVESANSTE